MVIIFGEVLIDFIASKEGSLDRVKKFEKYPGGAPANVAVAISSIIPYSATLISKVGKDKFGSFLISELKKRKVNVEYVFEDEQHHTGVVFVELNKAKPDFMIYSDVAYNYITIDDVRKIEYDRYSIFHCGTITLRHPVSRETHFFLLQNLCKKKIISMDVNIRMDLWKNVNELKVISKALEFVDILKAGIEELKIISDILEINFTNIEELCRKIKDRLGLKVLLVTQGDKGSFAFIDKVVYQEVYKQDKVVDTTGAGDCFMGAFLAFLLNKNIDYISDYIKEALDFAAFFSSFSVTKKGAWNIPSKIFVGKNFMDR